MNYSSFNTCQQFMHESNHPKPPCMKKSIILISLLLISMMEQVSAETIKKEKEVVLRIAIRTDSFDRQKSFILYSMNEASTAILK